MTSNEEMAEKLAEKFYGLIEGDVSVSGGELAKLFVTALDQAGLALSEKAKATYPSNLCCPMARRSPTCSPPATGSRSAPSSTTKTTRKRTTARMTPASDPWANGGSGYTTDMFAADTGDPEF